MFINDISIIFYVLVGIIGFIARTISKLDE